MRHARVMTPGPVRSIAPSRGAVLCAARARSSAFAAAASTVRSATSIPSCTQSERIGNTSTPTFPKRLTSSAVRLRSRSAADRAGTRATTSYASVEASGLPPYCGISGVRVTTACARDVPIFARNRSGSDVSSGRNACSESGLICARTSTSLAASDENSRASPEIVSLPWSTAGGKSALTAASSTGAESPRRDGGVAPHRERHRNRDLSVVWFGPDAAGAAHHAIVVRRRITERARTGRRRLQQDRERPRPVEGEVQPRGQLRRARLRVRDRALNVAGTGRAALAIREEAHLARVGGTVTRDRGDDVVARRELAR